jgi:2-hydroxychromene-2-carboxylate isomerase
MSEHKDETSDVQICNWYFDIISPFAYLQWRTRDRLQGRVQLRPVPVVLGALLNHYQQRGPAEIPPKRWHTYRYCQWRAAQLGVAMRFPPAHPFNPIAALRLIVALDASEAAVDAVFDAAFGQGQDVSEPSVLAAIGAALGLSDTQAAIGRPEVKQKLRENTDAAIADGIFGVPSIILGDEVFWGEDMTEMLIKYSENRDLFRSAEMRRLKNLPVGVQRQ